METTSGSVAYFCPECGGADVSFGGLVGSTAECGTCKWSGPREKLLAHAFNHQRGSDAELTQDFLNDMRKVYAASSKLFGEVLIKWGFVTVEQTKGGAQVNTRQLSRYIAAMALASFKALIDERRKMEQERVSGS